LEGLAAFAFGLVTLCGLAVFLFLFVTFLAIASLEF
jgi:hypothetical protein